MRIASGGAGWAPRLNCSTHAPRPFFRLGLLLRAGFLLLNTTRLQSPGGWKRSVHMCAQLGVQLGCVHNGSQRHLPNHGDTEAASGVRGGEGRPTPPPPPDLGPADRPIAAYVHTAPSIVVTAKVFCGCKEEQLLLQGGMRRHHSLLNRERCDFLSYSPGEKKHSGREHQHSIPMITPRLCLSASLSRTL